jgi:hypothetical protein
VLIQVGNWLKHENLTIDVEFRSDLHLQETTPSGFAEKECSVKAAYGAQGLRSAIALVAEHAQLTGTIFSFAGVRWSQDDAIGGRA